MKQKFYKHDVESFKPNNFADYQAQQRFCFKGIPKGKLDTSGSFQLLIDLKGTISIQTLLIYVAISWPHNNLVYRIQTRYIVCNECVFQKQVGKST